MANGTPIIPIGPSARLHGVHIIGVGARVKLLFPKVKTWVGIGFRRVIEVCEYCKMLVSKVFLLFKNQNVAILQAGNHTMTSIHQGLHKSYRVPWSV